MADLTTITASLSAVNHVISIAKHIRDSGLTFDKAEVKLKLAELTDAIAELKLNLANVKDEMIDKDEKIRELEAQINKKLEMKYSHPAYFLIADVEKAEPFCQVCFDERGKSIRLNRPDALIFPESWKCNSCGNNYNFEND